MNNAQWSQPRLLADVGGTNARFALEVERQRFAHVQVLACADYATFGDAIADYLARPEVRDAGPVRDAAIAIANPVNGDLIRMTNHHWSFSIEALRSDFDLHTLLVVNDFEALAMSLPYLSDDQRVQIGGSAGEPGRVIGLVGPGTGLGMAGLMPHEGRWIPIPCEGGHASFSPADREELALLGKAWSIYRHVSAERLLSGPGLELIHRVSADEDLAAPEITRRALEDDCPRCRATVERFCAMLGGVAGNVALTLGATGGIYIGGGIVPRLGDIFLRSRFRERFEDKGRLAPWLAPIPVWLITEPYPAFLGMSALLADRLGH